MSKLVDEAKTLASKLRGYLSGFVSASEIHQDLTDAATKLEQLAAQVEADAKKAVAGAESLGKRTASAVKRGEKAVVTEVERLLGIQAANTSNVAVANTSANTADDK